MQDILFVCTGNTCRSPMAEAIANRLFKTENLPYQAFSRGINVLMPARASENAVKAMQLIHQFNLNGHIARQVSAEDMQRAYLVLVMTESHKHYLHMVFPQYSQKVLTLCEFAGHDQAEIRDPYGQDLYEYRACADDLEKNIRTLFSRLRERKEGLL